MSLTFDVAFAQGCADVRAAIDAGLAAGELAPGERRCIVDGSMLSPSHRALARGPFWYRLGSRAFEAYTEGVDAEEADGAGDLAVYWEDGALFLEAPAADDEVPA